MKTKTDKNFTMKKVIKLENENKEKLTIEIKGISDSFINQDIIEQLERQLFNVELNINGYKISK